jgi:fructose-1,6-bisphosphatase/inositol monophosphatase family enzyme
VGVGDDGVAPVIDAVAALLRAAAAQVILPAFQQLGEDDIEEKAPGELVTVADRRAEEIITAGLLRLLPGSVVVGEEAVAADPALLGRLADGGPVWLVDPIDGTANFAAGRQPFAVMVALLRDGVTEASWILDPSTDSLGVAVAGVGAYVDGVAVRTSADVPPAAELRGAVSARFLPPELRASVEAGAGRLGDVWSGRRCAGREYLDMVLGRQHFALFWRTLPWDHAPGALLLRAAGGVVRRFDGTAYDPTDGRTGLLLAGNERIWSTVRDALLA